MSTTYSNSESETKSRPSRQSASARSPGFSVTSPRRPDPPTLSRGNCPSPTSPPYRYEVAEPLSVQPSVENEFVLESTAAATTTPSFGDPPAATRPAKNL